ncbi:MAG: hypothetical protein LBT76_00805 [Tannerella sp.]|jgi:C-terminal processing protease CtpA/Prc|nr:hypothetical protein [Tannerella sp.]
MKTNRWKEAGMACIGVFFLFLSCSKEVNVPDVADGSTSGNLTAKVNRFIADYVKSAYLWTSSVNWKTVDPAKEPDSFDFFRKLLHADDKWSLLTDDIQSMAGELEGISTSFGYRPLFLSRANSNRRYAVILFVYPGTPAAQAGIKRGDLFAAVNGSIMTEENYRDMYYASAVTLQRGIAVDGDVVPDPDSQPVSLTAVTMYQNPILKDTVIARGEKRIGYLSYADYTIESEKPLQEIFAGQKAQGVTEVVLDLRYNGGGFAQTSVVLSSILAPAAAVKGRELFHAEVWNENYMAYFNQKKEDLNDYFIDTLSVNMDLSRLFVLTSKNTASASESTIIGLDPYMEVVRIGTATHGKYCGGGLLSNSNDREIANWGMYLMLYRYTNRDGIPPFTNGLAPDFEVKEDYLDLPPFGDGQDPLLGKALELITGQAETVQPRSGRPSTPPLVPLDTELHGALNGKMIKTGIRMPE